MLLDGDRVPAVVDMLHDLVPETSFEALGDADSVASDVSVGPDAVCDARDFVSDVEIEASLLGESVSVGVPERVADEPSEERDGDFVADGIDESLGLEEPTDFVASCESDPNVVDFENDVLVDFDDDGCSCDMLSDMVWLARMLTDTELMDAVLLSD